MHGQQYIKKKIFNQSIRNHIPNTKTLVPFKKDLVKSLNPLHWQLCVPQLLTLNNKVFYPTGTLPVFVWFPADHQST